MNWLKRLFGSGKSVAAAPSPGAASSVGDHAAMLAEIDERARGDIAAAFRPEEEIATAAIEYFDGTYEPDVIRPLVVARTKELLAEHRAAERTWPEVTDCDRLERAFAELEARGIVCRQDFSCCGTCGAGEIRDEMEKVREDGRLVRGYTFYHMQDTESAVEGYGICLNFGSTDEGELAAVRIGHEICDAIRGQGLVVDWDGSWAKRISVKLDWKRRRKPRCVNPS